MEQKILDLIDLAINDGQITDKQKEIIYRKARELNIDETEVEIIIDSKLANTPVENATNKMNNTQIYAVASQVSDEEESISKRRLYRDTDNGKIAGVCAGIAKYLKCSTGIVRTVFILCYVISFYVYLVLAVVLRTEEDSSI
jgi:phage shock protein PspC (stress-responsive transcriptional regulator)